MPDGGLSSAHQGLHCPSNPVYIIISSCKSVQSLLRVLNMLIIILPCEALIYFQSCSRVKMTNCYNPPQKSNLEDEADYIQYFSICPQTAKTRNCLIPQTYFPEASSLVHWSCIVVQILLKTNQWEQQRDALDVSSSAQTQSCGVYSESRTHVINSSVNNAPN